MYSTDCTCDTWPQPGRGGVPSSSRWHGPSEMDNIWGIYQLSVAKLGGGRGPGAKWSRTIPFIKSGTYEKMVRIFGETPFGAFGFLGPPPHKKRPLCKLHLAFQDKIICSKLSSDIS